MRMGWPGDQTVIRQLRVKSARLDPQPVQWRLARLLNALSFHPAGLSPSAILCIRSLRDPKPGALSLNPNELRPPQDWERAVIAQMEQLAREAARPIDGAVPANAQAVIFRDRSELLACLAADWCAGEVITHWWWQSLRRRRDIAQSVIGTWLEVPEHIPGALVQLENQRLSTAFLQKLGEESAHKMLQSLVQTFGLSELVFAIYQDLASDPAPVLPAEETSRTMAIVDRPEIRSPWQPWIQDLSIQRLSLKRQFLLGVGLMLQRAPSSVRSASFAREVKAWQNSIHSSPAKEPGSQPHIVVQPSEDVSRAGGRNVDTVSSVDRTSVTKEKFSLSRREGEIRQLREAEFSLLAEPASPSRDDPRISISGEHRSRPDQQVDTNENVVEFAQLEIRSEFGGICYFINLGLYLDLYGDFTRPLQPGLDLPIWDFVALIAQQIFGEQVSGDPIWSLLAQLAGRSEGEPPGAHFDPPEHQSLQAWLAELMLTVRPRLQLALGVEDQVLPNFFRRPARIVVTATRLDVYFALADLPIEIRVSGLDRDPGWVPAAGKFIGFHYE